MSPSVRFALVLPLVALATTPGGCATAPVAGAGAGAGAAAGPKTRAVSCPPALVAGEAPAASAGQPPSPTAPLPPAAKLDAKELLQRLGRDGAWQVEAAAPDGAWFVLLRADAGAAAALQDCQVACSATCPAPGAKCDAGCAQSCAKTLSDKRPVAELVVVEGAAPRVAMEVIWEICPESTHVGATWLSAGAHRFIEMWMGCATGEDSRHVEGETHLIELARAQRGVLRWSGPFFNLTEMGLCETVDTTSYRAAGPHAVEVGRVRYTRYLGLDEDDAVLREQMGGCQESERTWAPVACLPLVPASSDAPPPPPG